METDLHRTIIEFIKQVLMKMGLTMDVEYEVTPEGFRIEISGDDSELLLKRRGEALDALQHIVNTAFRRRLPDQHLILIDCMNFRRNKDEELRRMVTLLIDRSKATGELQEIGPLNPYARRIVHLKVAEDPTMASESTGDAFLKSVVISVRDS
jgi:spoIIIJ-associated protein|tara:strand:+ start:553 stop:1011 length:459 start_codon:yes stop_codon:yes gene_type:complete